MAGDILPAQIIHHNVNNVRLGRSEKKRGAEQSVKAEGGNFHRYYFSSQKPKYSAMGIIPEENN
jgi:hypothetical protein